MPSVLVDTSVWVAHFRKPNAILRNLLSADQVLCHPLIILEIACGTPPSPRGRTLGDFRRLERAVIATVDETLALIERERLEDLGCGAVDVSLLASALLTTDALLWTIDKNLQLLAAKLGIGFH